MNLFPFLLVSNSFFTIGLILNQNESKKDPSDKQNSSSASSPFEKATWFGLFFQFFFLVLQMKIPQNY
jgi:hypothetical protein